MQELEQAVRNGVNLSLTFTSLDLLGVTMTLSDVISAIAPLDRLSCLKLLASLNWHSTWIALTRQDGWRNASSELDSLIQQFLPPAIRFKARLLANSDEFAMPVTEIGLLTLAGVVCRFGACANGITAETQFAQRELFRALLGVQGGISGRRPDEWKHEEFFRRTTQIVWRNISLQNLFARDLARLHAYLHIPEISASLAEPVGRWFERHLQITGEDYEAIANSLYGAASLSADFSSLFERFPEVERRMPRLLHLCSTSIGALETAADSNLTLDNSDPDALNEAQRLADEFFRTPLLGVDGTMLCMSSRLLFNRLHRGLHYLVVEPYQGDAGRIQQVRGDCGNLLERYVVWLLRQFLPENDVKIFHSFRIRTHGKHTKKAEPPERDIAVFAGERAFVFEVKSAIPNLGHRRRAEVTDFVKLFGEAVKQVTSSADALLAGEAFEDIELTRPLPKARNVFPCVICFEPCPLRFPVAGEFENAIEAVIAGQPFRGVSGRAPVQIFDIEHVEEFGDIFGLPTEWSLLFDAIASRCSTPARRYKPIIRDGSMVDGEHAGSSVLPKLLESAQLTSETRWQELTRLPST